MNHWAAGSLATCGVIGVRHQGTSSRYSWVDITSLTTAVVSSLGIHTDALLVTAVKPFLSLSVSLSIVNADLERWRGSVGVGHARAGGDLSWFGGGSSWLDGAVH